MKRGVNGSAKLNASSETTWTTVRTTTVRIQGVEMAPRIRPTRVEMIPSLFWLLA